MFEHIDYAAYFNNNLYVIKLVGLWKPDKDMKFKFLYRIYSSICFTLLFLFIASQCKLMYDNSDDVVVLTELIYLAGKYIKHL